MFAKGTETEQEYKTEQQRRGWVEETKQRKSRIE